MANLEQASNGHALIREVGLTPQSIERRKRIVSLSADDLRRIASVKDVILQNLDELAGTFFAYLGGLEEARRLVNNHELLERARQLKVEHLAAMVQGDYGQDYVEQRIKLGVLYSKAG